MNSTVIQKLFKNAKVLRLKHDLEKGKTLESYYATDWMTVDMDEWEIKISVPEGIDFPELDSDTGPAGDFENSKKFFNYYSLINSTLASDKRFWTYLSHVQFRNYALSRWAPTGGLEAMHNDKSLEQKARSAILEHWFTSDSSRSLRRHALARLWWAAKLTYAPWEADAEYVDMDKSDPYIFTGALFLTQDVYQAVLERNLGRSRKILFATLEFLHNNPEFSQKKAISHLTKGLNLEYGFRDLSNLNRKELLALLNQIASEYEGAGKK